ncbi:hypothetical protein ABZ934_11380 [Streptomyces sp. NPDC046557]|uniref:hypothetical protein n=1 Tax=Streptomyces sp. NPDC046557 TaxID=3155372 RepID=UPI0033F4DA4D
MMEVGQFEVRRRFELRYEQRFKCWLRKVDSELAFLPGPEGRSIDWIRDLYREHGELPASRFALLAFDRKARTTSGALKCVADAAGTATRLDIPTTPEFLPPSADLPMGNVAVAGSAIQSFDRQGVWAEVADAVQTYVADRHVTVWPLCRTHGLGLHAVVRGGEAIWWCNGWGHLDCAISPRTTQGKGRGGKWPQARPPEPGPAHR